jgi:hypothetical protein
MTDHIFSFLPFPSTVVDEKGRVATHKRQTIIIICPVCGGREVV